MAGPVRDIAKSLYRHAIDEYRAGIYASDPSKQANIAAYAFVA